MADMKDRESELRKEIEDKIVEEVWIEITGGYLSDMKAIQSESMIDIKETIKIAIQKTSEQVRKEEIEFLTLLLKGLTENINGMLKEEKEFDTDCFIGSKKMIIHCNPKFIIPRHMERDIKERIKKLEETI